MMILILKALAGAAVVLLISVFARSKNFYIAGLIPLFPTFTLIAHSMVGKSQTPEELKSTILFSMFCMIPYFAYLMTSYYLVDRMRFELALGLSTLVWCAVAGSLLLVWTRVQVAAI